MPDSPLSRYTKFFEQLTADNVDHLTVVMTDDVHFVDPFNDVRGIERVKKIFVHMFDNLESPRFEVTHAATVDAAKDDAAGDALLRWELHSKLQGKPYNITGMSEISFAPDGRVNSHIDHWDAGQQFYERLPVIGWILRTIRGRLAM